MWRLAYSFSGLRVGLCLGACALAGAVTGRIPLLPAFALLALSIGVIAWQWERLREYNREDRY
jgi:hypothetical protein